MKKHGQSSTAVYAQAVLAWIILAQPDVCPRLHADGDLPSELVADCTAIECVYYAHRRGTSRPFAKAVPREIVEEKVALALKKARLLNDRYGIRITPEQVNTEWRRIRSRTHAPAMLVEIEAALEHDEQRIMRALVKPLLVDRALRRQFAYDPDFHGERRARAESLRAALLALPAAARASSERIGELSANHDAVTQPVSWSLTDPRHPESPRVIVTGQDAGSRDYTVDASVGLPAPTPRESTTNSPESDISLPSLPPELRHVLLATLRESGDVSPVLDTPTGFDVYISRRRSDTVLSALIVRISKQSYNDWLMQTP